MCVVEKNSTKKKRGVKMPNTYDYRKLRGRIKEKYGTQSEFSSNKLNNIVDWGQEEIENIIIALEIPYTDIQDYFFTHIVEKNSTI